MKEFRRTIRLKAAPENVYQALVNREMLEIWTGEPAVMAEEPGTAFSLWDGSITGTNLAFEKNSLVRQQWDFGDQQEPSVVTLRLSAAGRQTTLEVIHTNIPDDSYDNMREGWLSDYLGGLEQLFEG